MASTVAGTHAFDLGVNRYVAGILGDVTLLAWSLDAENGDMHRLRVVARFPVSGLLDVVDRLRPYVQAFDCRVIAGSEIELQAFLGININELIEPDREVTGLGDPERTFVRPDGTTYTKEY